MKKKWTLPAIYVAAVVILAVIIYAVPSLLGLLDTTYLAEYGDIKVEDSVDDAWIVRDDVVYGAKKNATVDAAVKEGTLVKGKGRVLNMKFEGSGSLSMKYANLKLKLGDAMKYTTGLAGRSGYVSFSADGYEGELNSSKMDKLTEKQLSKVKNNNVDLSATTCASGQPLFRITKNGAWWLVFFVDKNAAKKYSVGSTVETTFDDVTVNTKVRSVDKADEKGQSYRVVLTCKEYTEKYLSTRKVSLTNVTESDNGLLIEERSIVKMNDQQGVLVKDKVGKLHFTPIKEKASDGENVAIYEDLYMDDQGQFVETVSNYDEIVRSPSKGDVKKAKENQ